MSNITIRIESAKGNKTITSNAQHAADLAGAWLEGMQPSFCDITIEAFGEEIELDVAECETPNDHGYGMVFDADRTVDAIARAIKAL